jgi:DNA-binding transcriptional LysR family regulator
LIAAPGTPNACVTPSRSITSTAAIAAFILAMLVSITAWGVGVMVGERGASRNAVDKHDVYSTMEYRLARIAMDRLSAVKLFMRVVELGSFSKAAAELGIGQPAVTKQVARMEQQLGARLLHRSTHGVTATEIGALYYEKCRTIAHHVDEADSVAALLQSQVRGAMRVSTSVAFGRRVLGPLLMRFMRANPDLQIDLAVDDRYVDLIEQGVDVAVRMGRLADSTLGARYLGMNPWVLVASPGFLAAREAPAQPQDLAARDCLIYSTVQGDARWHFTGAGGQAESVAVKGPLRSNSLSLLLEAAVEGLGIAALPRYVAQEALVQGTVVPLLGAWSLPAQEVHAVFPSPRMLPLKVSGFVGFLQAQFEGEWWTRVQRPSITP